MREWAKSLGSEGSSIHMLSDGNCELAEVKCCPTCCQHPCTTSSQSCRVGILGPPMLRVFDLPCAFLPVVSET